MLLGPHNSHWCRECRSCIQICKLDKTLKNKWVSVLMGVALPSIVYTRNLTLSSILGLVTSLTSTHFYATKNFAHCSCKLRRVVQICPPAVENGTDRKKQICKTLILSSHTQQKNIKKPLPLTSYCDDLGVLCPKLEEYLLATHEHPLGFLFSCLDRWLRVRKKKFSWFAGIAFL